MGLGNGLIPNSATWSFSLNPQRLTILSLLGAGCEECHRQTYTTEFSRDFAERSQQTIYPYTDMRLHDMGEGLADFDIDNNAIGEGVLTAFLAEARAWPPLWGLGLVKAVDPEATLLHGGRARTILEAIVWHGGEAQASRDNVLQMNNQQREQLLLFLNDV